MTDYKEIFIRIESTLKKNSLLSDSDFNTRFGRYKGFKNLKRNDAELFEMLTMIVFYSGFKSATVKSKEKIILKHFPNYTTVYKYTEKDVNRIIADNSMIKHEKKIRSCIKNAISFKSIVDIYGSFQNYIDNFHSNDSFENLILLKEELEYKFNYLGGVTVYHLLTNLGFNVLKPDRVILRIFKRLGLIESEKQFLKSIIQGRKFSEETGEPIRYIDFIFVKYGQLGASIDLGIENGICLEKNPKCNLCNLTSYCSYYKSSNLR
jgi:DNA-3-methyladenine glycosylase I